MLPLFGKKKKSNNNDAYHFPDKYVWYEIVGQIQTCFGLIKIIPAVKRPGYTRISRLHGKRVLSTRNNKACMDQCQPSLKFYDSFFQVLI